MKYIHRLWRLTKKRRRRKKKGKNVSYERCAEQIYIFPSRRSCRNGGKFQLFSQNEPHVSILKSNCHVSSLFTYMNFGTISTSFIICSIEPMFEINLLKTEKLRTSIFRWISKQRKRGIFQANGIKGITALIHRYSGLCINYVANRSDAWKRTNQRKSILILEISNSGGEAGEEDEAIVWQISVERDLAFFHRRSNEADSRGRLDLVISWRFSFLESGNR